MPAAQPFTAAQLEQVLQHITTTRHAIRDRAIVLASVLSGMRVNELAQLTVDDVLDNNNTVKSQIYFAANRVKHKHAGYVYISTRLQAELQAYAAQQRFKSRTQAFFYSQQRRSTGFSANSLATHLRSVYHAANVQASSHSGRKSFATSLATQSVSLATISKLLRHRHLSTTQRYIVVHDDLLRNAVELV